MDYSDTSNFGLVDYCFFSAMLLISTGIGLYASCRGNVSPEEFLMGNRSFAPLPIAMSLVTSFVSAISLLGFSGETYAHGMQIIWFIPGAALGIGAAAITTLPVLHPLKLTSTNEYIELRFKSSRLRKFVTLITTIKGLVYMGICLYAPTLALATVTPLSSKTYIFILGIVVTLYSSIGGLRAVVWTDVFQLTIMFSGLFIIVGVGLYDGGGPTKVWDIAMEGGRLEIFNTDPSIYVRHNIWNTFGNGLLFCASFYGVSQVNVQRISAVPTLPDAQTVLRLTVVGMIIIYFLIFLTGTIAYSAYAGCDPLARGLLQKKDEIIPHFVTDRLNFITGLPGVFVATIIGGALSTVSSTINSLVAMIWEDYCSKMTIFATVQQKTAGLINKILSFVIGGIGIGTAVLCSGAGSLIQFSLTLMSVTFGPIYGVFLLGLFFPKINLKGAWTGIVVSILLTAWISAGAFIYGNKPEPLPFSVEECSSLSLNISDVDVGITGYDSSHHNSSVPQTIPDYESENDFPLMKLYGISYTLYPLIGVFTCIIVALIVSCLTGNQDLGEVSPEYVSPIIRNFYWKKEHHLSMDELKSPQVNKITESND